MLKRERLSLQSLQVPIPRADIGHLSIVNAARIKLAGGGTTGADLTLRRASVMLVGVYQCRPRRCEQQHSQCQDQFNANFASSHVHNDNLRRYFTTVNTWTPVPRPCCLLYNPAIASPPLKPAN